MSDSTDNSADRLRRAIDAYLGHRSRPGESAAAFLAAHEELRDLLEPMMEADAPAADGDSGPATGTKYLGDFELLREVGRGGMGVVYEAEQVSLRRRVALKVLPAHLTLSPRQIDRFRREAAAAAKLRHPGIIPIHGVGEDAGTHFFAMDFVDGESLHDVVTRVSAEGDASNGIDAHIGVLDDTSYMEEVAEIGAQVAEALHFAHENGIIHRDIKPQNILLGADGKARVVDFGLALDEEREQLSRTGEFAGTPYYTSPEQALAKSASVDRRTDVFSLGVVLYEMLTLQRPFEGNTTAEVLHCIQTREAKSLRRHNRRVPRDLEVICLKAMEKERDARYATAGELAADLRRFLGLEPITAQPPGPVARLAKLVRRRKAASAAVALAAVLFVSIPIGYGLHQAELRARDLQALEDSAESMVEMMRLLHESNLRDTPGKSSLYLRQVARAIAVFEERLREEPESERWSDLLQNSHGYAGLVLLRRAHYTSAIRAFDRRIELLMAALKRRPDDLVTKRLLAWSYNNRYIAHRGLGQFDTSSSDLQRAMALSDEISARVKEGEEKGADYEEARVLRAMLLVNKGYLAIRTLTNLPQAEAWIREAMEIWKKVPDAVILATRGREKQVVAHTAFGTLLRATGRMKEAIVILRRALELTEESVGGYISDLARRRSRSEILHILARCYFTTRDAKRCQSAFEDAIAAREKLLADFPSSVAIKRNLVDSRNAFGGFLCSRGAFADAVPVLRRGSELARELLATEPRSESYGTILSRALDALGTALLRLGESTEEGEELVQEAIAVCREVLKHYPKSVPAHHLLGTTLSNLADWDIRKGAFAVARDRAREAVAAQSFALERNAKNSTYRRCLRIHYLNVCRALAGLCDHEEIAKVVPEIARTVDTGQALGVAAIYASRSAELVQKDEDLDDATRARRAEEYGDLAMGFLQRLLERKSYKLLAGIGRSAKFAAIREREDFRELVAELGQSTGR